MSILKRPIHAAGRAYIAKVVEGEEATPFRRHNERTAEYRFALKCIGRAAPRRVLDVGTGTTAWPALVHDLGCEVVAIDNVSDYWPRGMVNRHWKVRDHDIQAGPAPLAPYDLITCISVLEHVADHRGAMRNMFASLRPGGHLVLCGPYTDGLYVEDCYRAEGADPAAASNPYPCRSYSGRELDTWLDDSGAKLVEAEHWRAFSGRHWSQGERVAPPEVATLFAGNHACFLLRAPG